MNTDGRNNNKLKYSMTENTTYNKQYAVRKSDITTSSISSAVTETT